VQIESDPGADVKAVRPGRGRTLFHEGETGALQLCVSAELAINPAGEGSARGVTFLRRAQVVEMINIVKIAGWTTI
jgi:hypothetical protein